MCDSAGPAIAGSFKGYITMRRFLTAALAACLFATPAFADTCDGSSMPSPGTEINGPIRFFNDTPYAFRVLWSDFNGDLVEYGLLQPGEDLGLTTYINHVWLIEVNTPDQGWVCVGPVKIFDTEGCTMRIIHDDGYFGYDAGGSCDY